MFNVSSSSNLVYCISLISTFDNTQRKVSSFNVRLFEIDSNINLKKSVVKFKQIKMPNSCTLTLAIIITALSSHKN